MLFGIVIACFVFFTVGAFALGFVSSPRIRGSLLYYNKKVYHYSQITNIKISSMHVVRVFVGKKKLFLITKDFANYQSFLVWAEKCNIKIEKEPPVEMDEEKIKLMTLVTCLIIAVVVVILFVVGER